MLITGLIPHRASVRRSIIALGLAVLLGLALLVNVRPAAAAGPCGPPVASVIACENTLPGDPPSDWQVSGAGDSTIQGFATSMSVNVGQTEYFKINTPATSYHIDILRVGYYQGDGARKVVSNMLPTATLPQSQPACKNDTAPTGLIDCGNWAVSASWTVPSNAVSGLYLAHLVRNDTGGSSLIPVRRPQRRQPLRHPVPDRSTRPGRPTTPTAATACTSAPSTARPGPPRPTRAPPRCPTTGRGTTATGPTDGASWFMYAEYPMIRFLEENGYDVSYTSGVDVSQPGAASIIEQHKIFLYCRPRRVLVRPAARQRHSRPRRRGEPGVLHRERGVLEDQVRAEHRRVQHPEPDAGDLQGDPLQRSRRIRRTRPPGRVPGWIRGSARRADGGNPQNALTGQLFDVNAGTTDITVPSQYSKLRFWRNTRVASLSPGQSTTLDAGVGTLGYEWDVDADNGFRPARADGPVVDDRHRRAASSPTTAALPSPATAPPPTT